MQVPLDSEIVARRNYILDLMKTRSPLSGAKHTPDEYEAAKLEPVVLRPQASSTWRAPQFVWQVRQDLAQIVCPDNPNDCPDVDTGGYVGRVEEPAAADLDTILAEADAAVAEEKPADEAEEKK